MRYDVALAACKSYEDAEVSAALETAVTAAGGLDWVTPGMRVALKLNLVSAMKPEEAATVHPAVVCALVRMLQARGAHVVLGDSPGGLYNAAHLQRVYDVTGLRAAEALVEAVLQKESCFSLRQLALSGGDLIAQGIPQGPEIGEILNDLLQRVIAGELSNEKTTLLEEAVAFAQRNACKKK